MKVTRLNYHPDLANTYVVGEEGGPCLLIDLGDIGFSRIKAHCQKHHSEILAILLTHAHYDHIGGLEDFDKSIPVYIHSADMALLFGDGNLAYSMFGQHFLPEEDINFVELNDDGPLSIGEFQIEYIHTPYHTPGGGCYYFKKEGILFPGDSLFRFGIGRSDLPGGQPRLIASSLKKLAKLPKNTIVYPGHGPKTTIEDELRYNPYLQSI